MTIHQTGIGDGFPVRLMGIINVSSESFYKGSVYASEGVARIAEQMINNNASILDIGGRSTAPHAGSITVDEEKDRVQSALGTLLSAYDIKNTLISIDTQYRKVAEAAFSMMHSYGKEKNFILNDVSCLCTDPSLGDWLADVHKPVILMASHHVPGDSLGIQETLSDLSRGIDLLEKKGFSTTEKVIIDPAIGKWIGEKNSPYDLELVARLKEFRVLNRPILVGISRKSFIGSVLHKKNPDTRLQGTLAATAIAVFNGAHIVRTHDMTEETMDVVTVSQAVKNHSFS
ncbi:MAG: dihydropteroate synthase [Spirochaetales bacterium]|nr:dihydropteroate synthase [Spirochaetales bacterium]